MSFRGSLGGGVAERGQREGKKAKVDVALAVTPQGRVQTEGPVEHVPNANRVGSEAVTHWGAPPPRGVAYG